MKIKNLTYILVGLMPGSFVHGADSPATGISYFIALELFFALIFVLALIVVLSIVFKKINILPGQGNEFISVLGSKHISNKERLMLIQIGDDQVLLGMSHGGIRKLHKLSRNISIDSIAQSKGAGGQKFKEILSKITGSNAG